MSNLFSGFRSRGASKGGNTGPARPKTSSSVSSPSLRQQEQQLSYSSHSPPGGWSPAAASAAATTLPPLAQSESLSHSVGIIMSTSGDDILNSYHLPRPLPAWVNPAYAKHIVKGNFMTLIARPKTVEHGEWIAHQVVEHYRNLWHFVRVVYEKEDGGTSICNPTACPTMSAGPNHSYTWLNNRYEPIELPAYEYMTLMQRWVSSKTDDTKIFPTDPAGVSHAVNPAFISPNPVPKSTSSPSAFLGPDPAQPFSFPSAGKSSTNTSASSSSSSTEWLGRRSGFPKEFPAICQTIFLQMFRVYAHLYHAHFIDPFYHLHLEKQLNSCFSHFLLTATTLDLLRPTDLEPMQPLIDLWAANGTFPLESKAYQLANLRAGKILMGMGASGGGAGAGAGGE